MEVRERIIEEATHQFFQSGIKNVTMDEIAFALGISKRTVYEAFRDKTELIQTCMKLLAQKHEKINNEVITNSSNVIEAIFTFMDQGIKAINSINPVFFFDLKKYYPGIWKTIHQENTNTTVNLSYLLLKKGVNEGLFRKEIDVAIVSKLFHEQMNIIADEKIFPPDEYDKTSVFKNLIINYARGISTAKGIDVIDKILQKQTN